MKLLKYVLVFGFAFLLFMPLWWMITGSFKGPEEILRRPPTWWPRKPTLQAYRMLLEFPLGRWLMNSVVVHGLQVLGSTLITLCAGYGFAKKRFRGKEVLFWLLLSSLFVPQLATMTTLFIEIKEFGLLGTRAGMIIPFLLNPTMIFFYRKYLEGVPDEYLLIAEVDGASEWTKFTHIVLPLSSPAIATMVIIHFFGAFQLVLWPMIIGRTERLFTLPVGILVTVVEKGMFFEYFYTYSVRLAGAVAVFIPMLTLFFSFQKYLVKGLYGGGLKE